ncbi:outer membrane beta-barrel family protein [Cloacibacterium sp. TD35]|uniref:outer membrane beta-barrel family protein n=1 Tax=Cloacibacterium sp. TD35 TaxID=2976818 RepID=UPI00237EAC67|nr:outer membrane beta-barrel family protein [Cloacibacterium sp. TD35]WDT68892.1 outer membrane beta-barrel family protein [Cloacibacterium sp. TD35]
MKKLLFTAALLTSLFSYSQEEKTKDIQEVKMTKKVFHKKSDRMVYDVANSPVAKGSNAFELLKETPLISTSDNASLKILGKNDAIIYINGRKSNMSAEAVLEMLKNTPSENIQKIEVITVPSSEFQVESNQGIINIVMKKKKYDGMSGTWKLEDKQGYYNNPNTSVSLNYKKDKLTVSTNTYVGKWSEYNTYTLSNGTDTSSNLSVGNTINPNAYVGGNINADYEISDKQILGISYSLNLNKTKDGSSYFRNIITDYSNNSTRENITTNNQNDHSANHSLNLNYEIKTDTLGSKLSLNAAYLNFNQKTENVNKTSDINGVTLANFNQSIPQQIDNLGFMADYIQKFNKNLTLSVGGSYNKTKTDNDTQFVNILPPTGIDDNQSNHFIYDENIVGVYATLEKNFNDKVSTKLGTRLELTKSEGSVLDKDEHFTRDYNSFLPYASINYAINKNHNVTYSFSSRVRRPSFWELNPSRIYLTQTNYVQNNPFMKASQYYNQELNYMYKNTYFLVLNTSLVKDASDQIPLQKVENGNTVLRYIRTNFGDKQEFSATLGFQKNFYNGIWSANYTTTFGHNVFKGSVDTDPITGETFPAFNLNKSTNLFHIQANNNIRLSSKKDLFLGVNYFYLAPQQISIGKLSTIQSLDISVRKIWNNWTFLFEANDVFGTSSKYKISDVQSNGYYNNVRKNDYRRMLALTATYTFGNQKTQKARNIEGANKDIKNRTGN